MKTPITVRIETDLLFQARRCAREENRTLTNFIETVIRQRVGHSSSGLPTVTQPTLIAEQAEERPSHVA